MSGQHKWEEMKVYLAHEMGTYRVELTDSTDMPEIVEKMAREFWWGHLEDISLGWPDRDFLGAIEEQVREYLTRNLLIAEGE